MAGKRKTAQKMQQNYQTERDDGTRWTVVRHGKPVYYSRGGVLRREAQRLADGLLEPAEIIQVS